MTTKDLIEKYLLSRRGTLNPNSNKKEWFEKNGLLSLLDSILAETTELPPDFSILDRVRCIQRGIFAPPTCAQPSCNNQCKWNKHIKEFATYCGPSCSSSAPTVQSKIKATCQKKYGVDNYAKSAEYKEKSKATFLNKYGVSNPSKSKKVIDKIKQTNKERHGFESARHNPDIEKKIQATCQERYGVSYPLLSADIREKIRSTVNERYGGDSPFCSEDVRRKADTTRENTYGHSNYNRSRMPVESLEKINDYNTLSQLVEEHRISDLAKMLGYSRSALYRIIRDQDIEIPIRQIYTSGTSKFEEQVSEFVSSLGFNIERNNRKIIAPKELDIVVPDKALAIECNGVYWHSQCDRLHHLNKTLHCRENSLNLIHIWDCDWYNKPKIVQSRIKAQLGVNQRVYARNCSVTKISASAAAIFLNNNHIQGNCPASQRYGLEYNGELVAIMTFGKSRFGKEAQFELLRYCSQVDTNVVGGASRLFVAFQRDAAPMSVISYSDKMWSAGAMYQQLGFQHLRSTRPAYHYTMACDELESRIRYQKHKLPDILENFNPALSEWENMKNHGYRRVWDCGTDVWIWHSSLATTVTKK